MSEEAKGLVPSSLHESCLTYERPNGRVASCIPGGCIIAVIMVYQLVIRARLGGRIFENDGQSRLE